MVFNMERDHERSGQGSFGQYCKPIFVASDQIATSKKATQRECKHDGRQRVVKLKQRFTKDEAAKAEHHGPDDTASGIGHQKCAPWHAIWRRRGKNVPEPTRSAPARRCRRVAKAASISPGVTGRIWQGRVYSRRRGRDFVLASLI